MMQYMWLQIICFSLTHCSDPCTDFQYLFDDGGRSTQCGAGSDRCDRYLTERWYKVVQPDGPLQMPTTPVPLNSCSTVYPIWLNGTYPDVSAGIVDMTACVTTPSDDCEDSYAIQVKNCDTFYVFYLVFTDGCPERYCFGDNVCPTTTTPATTTTMTTTSTTSTTSTTATSVNTVSPETTSSTNTRTISKVPERGEPWYVVAAITIAVIASVSLIIYIIVRLKLMRRRRIGSPQDTGIKEEWTQTEQTQFLLLNVAPLSTE